MSGRGRGNVTIRRGVPNLALAGIREAAGTEKNAEHKRSFRGSSRGSRGAKRGRDVKYQKPELIQSEGIFSEGIFVGSKKSNRDSDQPVFTINSRNGTQPSKDKEDIIVSESVSFAGYEAEWCSETDEEKEILSSLIDKRSFISDIKMGDRLPIVLPIKDEEQYHNLMDKTSRMKLNGYVNDIDYTRDDTMNPTQLLSKKVGDLLLSRCEHSSSDSIISIQLPSVVNMLASSIKTKQENESEIQTPVSHSENSSTLPQLPKGKKIGKIQIRKNGTTVLRIGDTVMDLTLASSSDYSENAILLETKVGNLAAVSNLNVSGNGTGNAVYHIGEVSHRLIASAAWTDFEPTQAEMEKPHIGSPKKPDLALLNELRALEKESAKWADEIEKWTTP